MIGRVFLWTAMTICILFAGPTRADILPTPTGPVILTVSGAITKANAGQDAAFDKAMLAALGVHQFTTSNPWDGETVVFEGVLLSAILRAVGADGGTLSVHALDGYAADVPAADADLFAPILAWSRDKESLDDLGMGPLWLVYPYDSDPALREQVYQDRSVWQIERIVIR